MLWCCGATLYLRLVERVVRSHREGEAMLRLARIADITVNGGGPERADESFGYHFDADARPLLGGQRGGGI